MRSGLSLRGAQERRRLIALLVPASGCLSYYARQKSLGEMHNIAHLNYFSEELGLARILEFPGSVLRDETSSNVKRAAARYGVHP
jgi:hypothetical protein